MKLESDFVIDAPDVRVFDNFLDPDVLGPCIPGCESLDRIDDSHYSGVLVNEVAHVKFRAAFSVEIAEMSRPREVIAVMAGEDSRLASSLKVDARLKIGPRDDGSSDVRYEMNVILWGKLGRMGEAIIRRKTVDIEREFVKRFAAACVAGSTSAQPGAAEVVDVKEGLAPQGIASVPAAAADDRQPVSGPSGSTAAAPSSRGALGHRAPVDSRVSWWRRLMNLILRRRSSK